MRIAVFILIQAVCITAFTQEPVALKDKPGSWTYAFLDDANTKLYCQQYGMTPAEKETLKKKLDLIVETLHKIPVLAQPKGVDPTVESRPYNPYDFKKYPENYPYIGEMNFRLITWYNSKGKDWRQTIEPPRMTLYMNNIHLLKKSALNVAGPEGEDVKKAEILVNEICKPDKIKELAPDVVLYDAAIVFTKPGRPLYLPCTVGEAYKRLIAYYEASAKKEPAFGAVLQGIKSEYSSLTPAQLAGQAYFGGMFSGITPQKNNDPLYLFNNEYFDRTKPKTDIQLIVFPIDADYFRKESDFVPNDVGFLRIYQVLHALDYPAIAKLID
jgi:hypothetical protein